MTSGLTRRLRDGMAAAHSGQFERARLLLEEATEETPGSAASWFWLGLSSPTPAAAIRCLRRALEVDPSSAQARDTLARLLVIEGVPLSRRDRAAGCSLLVEASQVAPNIPDAWIALASLSQAAADRLTALRRAAALTHRSDLRARFHDALLQQALLLAKQGRKAEARPLFREAAELEPKDARVWQALAHLAETPADAIEPLRELTTIVPQQPGHRAALRKALVGDARALEAAGRKADALARRREAVALDDHDAELWIGLASVATDEREVRRALEAALSLDPTNPRAGEWTARLKVHKLPIAATQAKTTTRTILVVDDSPTIRKILSLTLERAGYAVVAEGDGEQAMARLADLVPDLILLDISMPKLDGYEVCKRIKKDRRTAHVPVVMLSGKDGFFDKVKGRMVGATEYLTKPFQAPAVLAVIASHCGGAAGEVSHG